MFGELGKMHVSHKPEANYLLAFGGSPKVTCSLLLNETIGRSSKEFHEKSWVYGSDQGWSSLY